MFKPLGLFAGSPCPDPSCHRHRCLFAHGETSKAAVPLRPVTRPSPRRGVDPELLEKARDAVASPGKKHAEVQAVARQSVAKRLRTEDIPLKTVEASLEENRIPGTEPMPRPPDPIANRPAKPPSIPTSIRNSPQPWADRQKALQTLFIQFSKLYSAILPNSPDLAQRSALEQEAEISTSHPNLKGYKSAIHHAAVSIARRPKPGSLTHPSIGTLRESRVATEAAEKQKASRLTRDRVERYSLPLSDFSTWRYPDPTDSSLTSGGGEDPSAEGTKQTCSRCKVPFIVSSVHLEGRFGECRYHYGRIAPERIEGRRKWIYSCCRRERGEAGCEEGVHVFTDGEEDGALARRVGFRTVQQVRGGDAKDGVDVVGVDCEMIYTTAGSSLARATIVDEDGVILLDELVRQTVPILDVNTRFSGIHPGELDTAIMDLAAVRTAACAFIGPDTIIVGHGLENDLRALRLVHCQVIDTAVVFPHDKGPPFRRALRDIVKEKLGYFIQDRIADLGHSSAIDARATLEVLKWEVREVVIGSHQAK